jgi:hypothetical protein
VAAPSAYRSEWRASLASTRARALSLVTPLSAAERTQAPAPGAWSVDQILEHLAVANALHATSMTEAMTSYGRHDASADAWKPTWLGRMLRNAVDPSARRKLSAPKRIVPGPAVSAGVLQRFVASLDELDVLLQTSEAFDLRRVRFTSPLARFLGLNLGDGFAICVAHVARHTDQIERTIARNRNSG